MYRSYDVIIYEYDVIAAHGNVYVNKSSQKRVKPIREVSLSLSCHDVSTDMNIIYLCNLSGNVI